MKVFALLVMLAGIPHANARATLQPCDSMDANPYYAGVNRIISGAVRQPSQLQLTTLPSFSEESGVRIVGDDIYFVQFRSFYWGEASPRLDGPGDGHMNFTKPKIATKTIHAPMSPALVRRVEQIYAKTIANAKQSNQMGLDGTSYIFSTSNGACGLAWSPDSKSQNGRLVELLQRLEKHAGLSTQIGLQSSEKSISELLRTMERD